MKHDWEPDFYGYSCSRCGHHLVAGIKPEGVNVPCVELKFDSLTDTYTLSTGKAFSANAGILGLGPGDCRMSGGYDQGVNGDDFSDEEEDVFTSEERQEIAKAMGVRWLEWAAKGKR